MKKVEVDFVSFNKDSSKQTFLRQETITGSSMEKVQWKEFSRRLLEEGELSLSSKKLEVNCVNFTL